MTTLQRRKRSSDKGKKMSDENREIKELVADILKDYQTESIINPVKLFEQPDRDIVSDILNKLIKIVFPAYYREKGYKFYNVESILTTLLEDVHYNLEKEIPIVLKQKPENEGKSDEEILAQAKEITNKFLRQIPKVREYVASDVQAAFEGDPAAYNTNEIILCYPGLRAIAISRLAHELFVLGVPIIPRMMTEYAHSRTGIDIHPGATIGKYFCIDHGTGIVIGETTIIGEYVKVYQGVTIGALSTRGGQSLRGAKRHPTIEDRVTIYAGASILGGETVIGHDAVIGSNAFITSSVEANARVSMRTQQQQ